MLSKLISPADIKINLESTEKEECFAELIEVAVSKQPQISRTEALEALCQREEKLSTAIFPFVAVPHAICKSIKKTSLIIGISRKGIEFDSVEPEGNSKYSVVNIVFLTLLEENSTEEHIHVLRDILQIVSAPDFVNRVLQANTSLEVYDLINEFEM